MEGLNFLIIIAVVAVVAVLAYYSWKAERQRTSDLAALARRLGFRFSPRRDESHENRYHHFEVFRQGHSRCAFNTLSGSLAVGQRAMPILLGDYEYKVTTSNGKTTQTTTYHFSFAIAHLPYVGVPDVLIRPEGFFDKIKSAIGFDDIDFESAEFSKCFFVKSADKRFAYDLIDPRMMEFLLATRPPGLDMERGRILLTDGSRRWEPAQFERNIQWLQEYLERWPRHLIDQLESGGVRSS